MQENGREGMENLAPTQYFDPDRRPTSNLDGGGLLSHRTTTEPLLSIEQGEIWSLDLEPKPIGPSKGIVLVERMPLIDLAWVGDDSMFQCLQPLVSTSLGSKKDGSTVHWSTGILRSASYTDAQRYSYTGTPSSLPPPWDGNTALAQDTDISTRASPNFNSPDATASSVGRPLLERNSGSPQSDESIQGYQSEQWNERYFELVEFHREFGHCLVPYHYKANVPLALWVARQRHQYNLKKSGLHSNMTDERQRALDDLGFVWDSRKATWEERLNELKEFRNQKGHCNVPATYEENPKLASWVKCQRRQYRLFQNGQKSNMNQARISRLMEIGFSWDPRLKKKKKR